ncbi:MAG: precorrin-6y C5,15-methyltransferase (decarboxylating) subunit CbiE [Actinomycetota bacterium]|nr:precorrin-6y C5,15-methyltransferase (decarboxylating) subunit CbiE [Actinomycetota bacterium]
MAEATISVIGLQGGEWFGRATGAALDAADVVIGARRLLDALPSSMPDARVPYTSIGELLDLVEEHVGARRNICVLASGDPGFFGVVRILRRFGAAVAVHPAPSSVSLAFARVGLPWDDASVVSAHGRSLEAGWATILASPKVAVLTGPDTPPEAVGRALLRDVERDIWVCSRLGETDEMVVRTDAAGLAVGRFDPLSVVLIVRRGLGDGAPRAVAWKAGHPPPRLGFGRPVADFAHRAGMITKPEVRAVILSKLDLHAGANLWDVGAGSGSVAIEAARLAPGLAAWAIERRLDDCRRIAANAGGLAVTVVEGEAPECLAGLVGPDRAFVGGGGIEVLDAVCARVAPGGVVVASFAALDRATAAAARLGNLVQISVNRAQPIGAGGALRLGADNPIFVAWGRPVR